MVKSSHNTYGYRCYYKGNCLEFNYIVPSPSWLSEWVRETLKGVAFRSIFQSNAVCIALASNSKLKPHQFSSSAIIWRQCNYKMTLVSNWIVLPATWNVGTCYKHSLKMEVLKLRWVLVGWIIALKPGFGDKPLGVLDKCSFFFALSPNKTIQFVYNSTTGDFK